MITQAPNRLFILSIESTLHRLAHTGYYIPKVEIKDYNIIIDRRHLFDQPIKNYFKIYDNIRKIAIDQGYDKKLDVY